MFTGSTDYTVVKYSFKMSTATLISSSEKQVMYQTMILSKDNFIFQYRSKKFTQMLFKH